MSAMRAALIAAGFDPDSNAAEVGRYNARRRPRRWQVLRHLTDEQVIEVIGEIRAGTSPTDIARRYGISRAGVYAIEAGTTYRDITGGALL